MNLVYGSIVEIESDSGLRIGKVRVSGAVKKVPLDLIGNAEPGDQVLLCDNVAIAKVAKTVATSPNNRHSSIGVPRRSRAKAGH